VTNGDSCVVPLEELGTWRADDAGSAQDDRLLASDLNSGSLDELDDAIGCARQKPAEIAHRDLSLVDRVQPVDVFLSRHSIGDEMRVDLIARVEGHLDDDAMELRVHVELVDLSGRETFDRVIVNLVFTRFSHLRQKLAFRNCLGKLNVLSMNADLGRRLELHPNVNVRVLAAANLNDCQSRPEARQLFAELRDIFLECLADFPVDEK
jgi:hypothetical protein